MRLLIFAVSLLAWTTQASTTYTEFYIQTTGDNLNSGSSTDNGAKHTYAGGTFVRSTGVFTVASGSPVADGVTPGVDWASVYTTSGATTNTFTAMVTGTNATTITVSLTAKAGDVTSVSESAAAATCKIGGAWAGPSSSTTFPFNYAAATMTNTSSTAQGYPPRINFKSGTTYSVTGALSHTLAGPIVFSGYTTNPGDFGRATIDGGTSGTSYNLISVTGHYVALTDFIFSNNGASGSGIGVTMTQMDDAIARCIVHDIWGFGITANVLIECEVYACNKGNNAAGSAVSLSQTDGVLMNRCFVHDNPGSNINGVNIGARGSVLNSVIASSGAMGINWSSTSEINIIGCDIYNNTKSGINITNSTSGTYYIENCNLIKNGGYGIVNHVSGLRNGFIINCGFGSGTQANTAGTIANVDAMQEIGSVTYAANQTPWRDPANGDFRINLAAAINAGRGTFTETGAYSAPNTVSYPNIGATQNQVGGTTTTVNQSFPIFQ